MATDVGTIKLGVEIDAKDLGTKLSEAVQKAVLPALAEIKVELESIENAYRDVARASEESSARQVAAAEAVRAALTGIDDQNTKLGKNDNLTKATDDALKTINKRRTENAAAATSEIAASEKAAKATDAHTAAVKRLNAELNKASKKRPTASGSTPPPPPPTTPTGGAVAGGDDDKYGGIVGRELNQRILELGKAQRRYDKTRTAKGTRSKGAIKARDALIEADRSFSADLPEVIEREIAATDRSTAAGKRKIETLDALLHKVQAVTEATRKSYEIEDIYGKGSKDFAAAQALLHKANLDAIWNMSNENARIDTNSATEPRRSKATERKMRENSQVVDALAVRSRLDSLRGSGEGDTDVLARMQGSGSDLISHSRDLSDRSIFGAGLLDITNRLTAAQKLYDNEVILSGSASNKANQLLRERNALNVDYYNTLVAEIAREREQADANTEDGQRKLARIDKLDRAVRSAAVRATTYQRQLRSLGDDSPKTVTAGRALDTALENVRNSIIYGNDSDVDLSNTAAGKLSASEIKRKAIADAALRERATRSRQIMPGESLTEHSARLRALDSDPQKYISMTRNLGDRALVGKELIGVTRELADAQKFLNEEGRIFGKESPEYIAAMRRRDEVNTKYVSAMSAYRAAEHAKTDTSPEGMARANIFDQLDKNLASAIHASAEHAGAADTYSNNPMHENLVSARRKLNAAVDKHVKMVVAANDLTLTQAMTSGVTPNVSIPEVTTDHAANKDHQGTSGDTEMEKALRKSEDKLRKRIEEYRTANVEKGIVFSIFGQKSDEYVRAIDRQVEAHRKLNSSYIDHIRVSHMSNAEISHDYDWIAEKAEESAARRVAADRLINATDGKRHSFLMRMLTSSTVLNVGSMAMAGINPAMVQIVNLAGAIEQLSQSALVVPAIFGSIGTSVGVASVGFKGVFAAVSALNKAAGDGPATKAELKKVADTMGNLDTNAANAAVSISALTQGPLKDLAKSIQHNMFAGLDKEIDDIGAKLVPRLTPSLGRVASAWNDSLKKLSGSVKDEKNLSLIDRFIGNTAAGQMNLNKAIDPFVHAFATLTSTGGEFLPRLGDGIAKLGTRFDTFMSNSGKSGQLWKWIDEGLNGMTALGNATINLGRMLRGFTQAAGGDGGFLGWLRRSTKAKADFLNSDAGQAKWGEIFRQGRDMVHHFGEMFRALWPALKVIVDGFSRWGQVITQVSTVLGTVVGFLGKMPGLIQSVIAGMLAWKTLGAVISSSFRGIENIGTIFGRAPAQRDSKGRIIRSTDRASFKGGTVRVTDKMDPSYIVSGASRVNKVSATATETAAIDNAVKAQTTKIAETIAKTPIAVQPITAAGPTPSVMPSAAGTVAAAAIAPTVLREPVVTQSVNTSAADNRGRIRRAADRVGYSRARRGMGRMSMDKFENGIDKFGLGLAGEAAGMSMLVDPDANVGSKIMGAGINAASGALQGAAFGGAPGAAMGGIASVGLTAYEMVMGQHTAAAKKAEIAQADLARRVAQTTDALDVQTASIKEASAALLNNSGKLDDNSLGSIGTAIQQIPDSLTASLGKDKADNVRKALKGVGIADDSLSRIVAEGGPQLDALGTRLAKAGESGTVLFNSLKQLHGQIAESRDTAEKAGPAFDTLAKSLELPSAQTAADEVKNLGEAILAVSNGAPLTPDMTGVQDFLNMLTKIDSNLQVVQENGQIFLRGTITPELQSALAAVHMHLEQFKDGRVSLVIDASSFSQTMAAMGSVGDMYRGLLNQVNSNPLQIRANMPQLPNMTVSPNGPGGSAVYTPNDLGGLLGAGKWDGGVLPGYSPGKDNMLVPMSGGEGVVIPEAMKALGSNWLYNVNSNFRSGISRTGYAGGGIVGGYDDGGIISEDPGTMIGVLRQIRDVLTQRLAPPAGPQDPNALPGGGGAGLPGGRGLGATGGGGVTPGQAAQGMSGDWGSRFMQGFLGYFGINSPAGGGGGGGFQSQNYADLLSNFARTGVMGPDLTDAGLDPSDPVIRAIVAARGNKQGPGVDAIVDMINQTLGTGSYNGPIDSHDTNLLGALQRFDVKGGRQVGIPQPGIDRYGNPKGGGGYGMGGLGNVPGAGMGGGLGAGLTAGGLPGADPNALPGVNPSAGLGAPPGQTVPVFVTNWGGAGGQGQSPGTGLPPGVAQVGQAATNAIGSTVGDVGSDAAVNATKAIGGIAFGGVRATNRPAATMASLTKEGNLIGAAATAAGLSVPDYTMQGGNADFAKNTGPAYDPTGRLFDNTISTSGRTSSDLGAQIDAMRSQLASIGNQTVEKLSDKELGPVLKSGVSAGMSGVSDAVFVAQGTAMGQAAGPPIAQAVAAAMPTGSSGDSSSQAGTSSANSIVNSVVGAGAGLGSVIAMADGGLVSGGTPGVDSVPILAQANEWMLNTVDVKALGGPSGVAKFVHGLRTGKVRRYATGGSIGQGSAPSSSKVGATVGSDFFGVSQIPIIGTIINALIAVLLKVIGINIDVRNTLLNIGSDFKSFRGDAFKAFDAQGRLYNDTSGMDDRSATSSDTATDERVRILKQVLEGLIKFIIDKIIVPLMQAIGQAAVNALGSAVGAGISTAGGGPAGGVATSFINAVGDAGVQIASEIGKSVADASVDVIGDMVADGMKSVLPGLVKGLFDGGLVTMIVSPIGAILQTVLGGMLGGLTSIFGVGFTAASTVVPGMGVFDQGGIASGKGFLPKAVDADELVLSPQHTDVFTQFVSALNSGAFAGGGNNTTVHAPITVMQAGPETATQVQDRLLRYVS